MARIGAMDGAILFLSESTRKFPKHKAQKYTDNKPNHLSLSKAETVSFFERRFCFSSFSLDHMVKCDYGQGEIISCGDRI